MKKYCRHEWSYKSSEENAQEFLKEYEIKTCTGAFADTKTCNKCLKVMWTLNKVNWTFVKK